MKDLYTAKFPSISERVRGVVVAALSAVEAEVAMPAEQRDDLKLVLNELLYNAVMHGNDNNKKASVHLVLGHTATHIHGTVQDEGTGFDHESLLQRAQDGFTAETLQCERGRGITLVCALTDQLTFHDKGSRIDFTMQKMLRIEECNG